ncbi:MAG: hypothetical protein H5T84_01900, partial [Thermoleophilia bacterium]|nr:hypothetical protein [Thermoleophilia bacterium]
MPSTGGQVSLTDVLGLAGRELVALVGGGGKSTLLLRLAGELGGRAARVLVTTTTAMYADQLARAGPVFWVRHWGEAARKMEQELGQASVVALA